MLSRTLKINAVVLLVGDRQQRITEPLLRVDRDGHRSADAQAPAGVRPGAPAGMRAPDISSMSPDERASRLFDRVMRYGEQGKIDSLKIFAPMAIEAYDMLGPPDAHDRPCRRGG